PQSRSLRPSVSTPRWPRPPANAPPTTTPAQLHQPARRPGHHLRQPCSGRPRRASVHHDHHAHPTSAVGLLGVSRRHGLALNTPAYSAVGIPMVVTVHGPIDDDLYPYYRVLGDEVGLIAISDRQRELAPDLNWVGRVHNALRVDEWPFRADKGDYAVFLGRYAPYKGAHLALRAAHQAGIPLVLAGKCNEAPEQAYFNVQVRPLLTENDH